MNRARRAATVALLWAAGWNLWALAHIIERTTGRTRRPGSPLHLPVETVTQQLRTIEVLMDRIGRP